MNSVQSNNKFLNVFFPASESFTRAYRHIDLRYSTTDEPKTGQDWEGREREPYGVGE